MEKKIDKELKELVEKLKKEKKPTWGEIERQGSWEVSCSEKDIWGKKRR